MSSISVRFNSFLFLYSIFNERNADFVGWSVWMDSNHRPHAYQACALATWATNRFLTHRLWFNHHASLLGVGTTDWWRWWGSNPWPPACRAGALPAELHPHVPRVAFSKIISWSPKIEQQKFHTQLSVLSGRVIRRLRQIREKLSWSP